MTVDGLKISLSSYGPSETMERILAFIAELGMGVLARIDHSAAAAKVGMELRPTEVVLFGNPKTGTPLMQEAQTMGIDLPLKILVWRGSASLSVQPERRGGRVRPEIAWGSDIFSRGGRDAKPAEPRQTGSHTSPDSYDIWWPTLCTESEAEPV